MKSSESGDAKPVLLISALAGLIGGLCCLTPIVLVLLGLSTISAAAGLGNVLYGDYRWVFRTVALVFLALALIIYFRKKGVCTLDQARRERNRIINTSLVVLIFGAGIYIFWTYIAVHYWGIAVGLPWAQYDESWALPAAAVVLGAALVLYLVLFRGHRKVGSPKAVDSTGPTSNNPG
jgi:MerT mercuric transport protein